MPRGLSALTAAVSPSPSAAAAAGGPAGTGQGAGNSSNGQPPAAALLACGRPPTGLVRETFSFAINICQVRFWTLEVLVREVEEVLRFFYLGFGGGQGAVACVRES